MNKVIFKRKLPKNDKALDSVGRTLKSKNQDSPHDNTKEHNSKTTAAVLLEWTH